MRYAFGKFFLLCGIVFFTFGSYLLWQRNNPNRIAFDTYSKEETSVVARANPTHIAIPDIDVLLPIEPAQIIDNVWEDTKKGVSYLSISPLPGEIGNSILYGHNWPTLLGRLPQIKPGDKILITYPDQTLEFTVQYTMTVSPNDTHILNQTDDRRITIYTCVGFLDNKRFVVTAVLN